MFPISFIFLTHIGKENMILLYFHPKDNFIIQHKEIHLSTANSKSLLDQSSFKSKSLYGIESNHEHPIVEKFQASVD